MFTTDVKSFLGNFMRGGKKRMLHPMENPEFLKTTAGKRAEYARDLLGSDTFTEIIQFMNEEVVQDISTTDPLDRDRLVVLRLRLQTITDFSFRLATFIDEYELIKFEEFREEQQRLTDDQEAA